MTLLATLLHTILSCLRAGTATRATQRRPHTEFPVWSQIDLLAAQLEQLYAQWRADTLRDCREVPDSAPPVPAPAAIGHQPVAVIGSQHEHVVARPDFAEVPAAAPQAGRLLRPLCHALGVILPPELIQPPRKPRPKAKPPAGPSANSHPKTGYTDTAAGPPPAYPPPPDPPSISRPRARSRSHARNTRC